MFIDPKSRSGNRISAQTTGPVTVTVTAPGAPTAGGSRLSVYTMVLATVLLAVAIVTGGSMKDLASHFGSWDTNAAPSKIDVRTSALRTGEKHATATSTATATASTETTVSVASISGVINPDESSSSSSSGSGSSENTKSKDKVKTKTTKKKKQVDSKTAKGAADNNEIQSLENGSSSSGSNESNSNNKSDDGSEEVETRESSTKPSKLDGKSLLEAVSEARRLMIDHLRVEYGEENFDAIFKKSYVIEGEEEGKHPFPEKLRMEYPPFRPVAPKDHYFTQHFSKEEREEWERKIELKYYNSIENMRRKMMIKILGAHLKDGGVREKYVWATGGHSAAAGHGNLFHETYTAVMEDMATGVFESAGLELEARNYAMGATSSAAEMAMCFREIYGDDVDIFSWDFGMLESRDYLTTRLLHYATRGILSNQKGVVPAFIALQQVDNARREMIGQLQDAYRGGGLSDDGTLYDDPSVLENNGLAIFLRDEDVWKKMKEAIPDTQGLSGAEIEEMPSLVRYFRCGDAIEKGDPGCLDHKYSEEHCPARWGKASWHPGWKYHALVGNSMALFLTDILVSSVREIKEFDDHGQESLEELLSRLQREENGFRDQMIKATSSQLPKDYDHIYWINNTNDEKEDFPKAEKIGLETGDDKDRSRWKDFDRDVIFRGPSLCHTARVPSQTRFQGHLTNQHDMTGKQTVYGQETYFVGIEDRVYNLNNNGHPMRDDPESHDIQLVWTSQDERDRCGDIVVKPDYHDYFMADETEGWTTMVFPNEAEQDAYGYHRHKDSYKGILVIVPRFCGFGNCERGFLGHKEYNNNKDEWEIVVNGKKVTRLNMIGHEAILLEHEDGIIFDPHKDDGRYHFELKVNKPKHFIKISAFVLY